MWSDVKSMRSTQSSSPTPHWAVWMLIFTIHPQGSISLRLCPKMGFINTLNNKLIACMILRRHIHTDHLLWPNILTGCQIVCCMKQNSARLKMVLNMWLFNGFQARWHGHLFIQKKMNMNLMLLPTFIKLTCCTIGWKLAEISVVSHIIVEPDFLVIDDDPWTWTLM